MAETGESKRDQAVVALCKILASAPYRDVARLTTFVGLIVDAAREEIRAELAEEAEERRWHALNAAVYGPDDGPLGEAFWEEWRALKAKREAAGKSTD
jgi:hypothetical protein